MKIKNKKTGEIVEVESCNSTTGTIGLFFAEGRECDRAYSSLAELCEEWEDYKEPKELYIVDARHECYIGILNIEENPEWCARLVELGLGFETKEEAELAVRKLKAWKKLKDKGADLDLLFSRGEE